MFDSFEAIIGYGRDLIIEGINEGDWGKVLFGLSLGGASIIGGLYVINTFAQAFESGRHGLNMSEYDLIKAAKEGDKDLAQKTLQQSIDVNTKDSNGRTALMYALMSGHIDVAKFLVGKGADLNIKNNDGYTALQISEEKGDHKIVEILRQQEKGILLKESSGPTTPDSDIKLRRETFLIKNCKTLLTQDGYTLAKKDYWLVKEPSGENVSIYSLEDLQAYTAQKCGWEKHNGDCQESHNEKDSKCIHCNAKIGREYYICLACNKHVVCLDCDNTKLVRDNKYFMIFCPNCLKEYFSVLRKKGYTTVKQYDWLVKEPSGKEVILNSLDKLREYVDIKCGQTGK